MMAKADQRRWQVWNNWTATWQIIEVFAERPRRTIGSANMVAVETLARRTGKGIGSCCSAAFDVWQRRGADKLAASPMHATVALLPVVSSHPPPPPRVYQSMTFNCAVFCLLPRVQLSGAKGWQWQRTLRQRWVRGKFGSSVLWLWCATSFIKYLKNSTINPDYINKCASRHRNGFLFDEIALTVAAWLGPISLGDDVVWSHHVLRSLNTEIWELRGKALNALIW